MSIIKINKNLERYVSSDSLNLIILPTEQCNFRCVYCYENFDNAKKMKKEIINSIKNLISIRVENNLNFLNISWFGGEPLTAYNTVIEIMKHSIEVCNDKTNLTSDMTTNGYLLSRDKMIALTKNGVKSYQISFDGDKDYHDKFRLRADKKGTFDILWKNIIEIGRLPKNIDFHVTLRIHVNSKNIDSVKLFLRRTSKDLKGDDRFSVFIRPLSRLGSQNDSNLPLLNSKNAKNKSDIILMLRDIAKTLDLKVSKIPKDYVCYASFLNSLIIRQDGKLSKCTVALYNSKNSIGKINNDGTIEINRNKSLWWSRGLFTNNHLQLSCPLNEK